MLECKHFHFCTPGVLSYCSLINRHFLQKPTSWAPLKGGKTTRQLTLTSVVCFATSCCFKCRHEHKGTSELRLTPQGILPHHVHVCVCTSCLCWNLETGKVCRSKSLGKAALIRSRVKRPRDICKWTKENRYIRQKARAAEEEVKDLITRLKLSEPYLNLFTQFSSFL